MRLARSNLGRTRRFASADAFTAWLEANHRSAGEVWISLPKKGTQARSVTRSEALDVALCYGWIDSKAFSGDMPDGWWAQRFSPRRPRSPWSRINRGKVEALIAAGRMRPAGLEQVSRAKADGRWAGECPDRSPAAGRHPREYLRRDSNPHRPGKSRVLSR